MHTYTFLFNSLIHRSCSSINSIVEHIRVSVLSWIILMYILRYVCMPYLYIVSGW